MKNIIKLFSLALLLFAGSCSILELEENLENPNEVGVGNLDVNLVMNQAMLDFADFFSLSNEPSMELSRMMALTGGETYARAYQAQSHNDIWNRAYQDVLINIETMLGRTDGTGLTVHSGVGRILKAYVLLTLVDLFNDVPYSEAIKGAELIFNPKADGGQAIYNDAIKLLDEAIELLSKTPTASISRDIYYAGNRTRWTALANTLKLKAHLNMRIVEQNASRTAITALLSSDLIDTDAEEFTYRYGTADVPARSRHPRYRDMYRAVAGSASGYLSNYYMLTCYNKKGVEDPRWRYYFYRQVGSINTALDDDPKSIPCIITPRPSHYAQDQAWCVFDPGFFGRDHGNNDGLPPDTRAKTCFGVYPAGGLSDTNDGDDDFLAVTRQGMGANGAGIEPIWMASYTDFLKAEAALTLNTTGDPKDLMLSGIQKSITRVKSFGDGKGQSVSPNMLPSQDDYITFVSNLYDSSNDKLDVIMREYYIALWGNGVEAYNLYRRTGKPTDIQPMRAATSGTFLRSLLYPADYVNLNSAANQKIDNGSSRVYKVFWDTNPDDFIR